MARIPSQQLTLKPQDLLILLALWARESQATFTYSELAAQTGLASSAVHSALKRAAAAGLIRYQNRQPVLLKPQLREFMVSGAKYAFPAVQGRVTRGVPTAYAAAPLNSVIVPSDDPPPVWPHKKGSVRGVSLVPLYPTAPDAALRDAKLYELLALFDTLRSGQARERNLAKGMLEEQFPLKELNPNIERTEIVAAALGPLREQLVFVGGCAAGLLISDPAATPIRATRDVDLVTHVAVLSEYHRFEKEFAKLGFKRDMTQDGPICRWVYRQIEVDLMPAKSDILGFANRWYPLAVQDARPVTLPSGTQIRLISAPVFLGTKFEAFADRGGGDLLASHDLEDILNVVAGRAQLLQEIERSDTELQRYLAQQSVALMAMRDFENYLPGMVQDDSSGEQSDLVLERLRAIADLRA